jgi:hypothetical protein
MRRIGDHLKYYSWHALETRESEYGADRGYEPTPHRLSSYDGWSRVALLREIILLLEDCRKRNRMTIITGEGTLFDFSCYFWEMDG